MGEASKQMAELANDTLLLVDDNLDHLEMVKSCVSRMGLDCTSVPDGLAALEALKEARFSLVISDIKMPGLDGLGLLLEVQKRYPGTDVILMTGYSSTYSFTDVIKAGATDYLEKPFTRDALRAKIFRILKERALLAKYHQELAQRKEMERVLEEKVRQRTQELQVAQSALEAVFQSIPDGVLSVNENLVVSHSNEQFLNYLHLEMGGIFQSGVTPFQDECARVLQHTLKTQESVVDYRLEIDGGEIQPRKVVLVSTSPLVDAGNGGRGALLIIHDITRLADLEEELLERRQFRHIVGNSVQMQEIYKVVRKLAAVDTAVLITGESGTGKEVLVDTLHSSSNRAAKPLIKVNCAALPENLLESELFGHVRGAFTGASKDRQGRIQAAEGGVLFLDEIGDISPRIQLKLLRFLEVKEFERVGESKTRKADVRVFAATNADLAQKVRQGVFREDLYYRLKVMVIHIPPLRERSEDIPFLIEHFLAHFARTFNKTLTGISPEVLDILLNNPWQGNVRELKHVIEHACLLASGNQLRTEHLPKDLLLAGRKDNTDRQSARALTRDALLNALRLTDWNKAKAARRLKLSRATLYIKMREFDLHSTTSSYFQ